MASPQSERALRRMILRLRDLSSEDFDAVIEMLDDSERPRVLKLLAQLGEQSQPHSSTIATPPFAEVVLPSGLSPWLVARVNGKHDDGDETMDPFFMTPHAQQSLRRCAATMTPQPEKRASSPSLLSRLVQGFSK